MHLCAQAHVQLDLDFVACTSQAIPASRMTSIQCIDEFFTCWFHHQRMLSTCMVPELTDVLMLRQRRVHRQSGSRAKPARCQYPVNEMHSKQDTFERKQFVR